jgi:2-polyprenyl-6-methoxyphenol hydroxylase-like FAD-dependent oxidoreductase
VIGGGAAGLAAALGAARTGARTRLVERYGFSAAWRRRRWSARYAASTARGPPIPRRC